MLVSDFVGLVREVPSIEPPRRWMPTDITDGQRLAMLRFARREPFEAVAKADDFESLVDAFNGGRRDDAVDAGRRSATDQNSQSASAHVDVIDVNS